MPAIALVNSDVKTLDGFDISRRSFANLNAERNFFIFFSFFSFFFKKKVLIRRASSPQQTVTGYVGKWPLSKLLVCRRSSVHVGMISAVVPPTISSLLKSHAPAPSQIRAGSAIFLACPSCATNLFHTLVCSFDRCRGKAGQIW